MSYRFSLAFLTVSEVSPPEAVTIAAKAGYAHVGLRLLPSATEGPYPLLTNNALLRETRNTLNDTGITVADIEIVRLGPSFNIESTKQFLERGAELGAKNILVAGDDPDLVRCTDNFREFCQLAEKYNMTADFEFMPWTEVTDVLTAQRIVEAADCKNGGILVDALHFQRSASTLAQIADIDNDRINYVQLCDAPSVENPTTKQLLFTAREERLYPGEGDIDLRGLLSALPKDTVLSIETPHKKRAKTRPALQRAQEAIAAAKSLTTQ